MSAVMVVIVRSFSASKTAILHSKKQLISTLLLEKKLSDLEMKDALIPDTMNGEFAGKEDYLWSYQKVAAADEGDSKIKEIILSVWNRNYPDKSMYSIKASFKGDVPENA